MTRYCYLCRTISNSSRVTEDSFSLDRTPKKPKHLACPFHHLACPFHRRHDLTFQSFYTAFLTGPTLESLSVTREVQTKRGKRRCCLLEPKGFGMSKKAEIVGNMAGRKVRLDVGSILFILRLVGRTLWFYVSQTERQKQRPRTFGFEPKRYDSPFSLVVHQKHRKEE